MKSSFGEHTIELKPKKCLFHQCLFVFSCVNNVLSLIKASKGDMLSTVAKESTLYNL